MQNGLPAVAMARMAEIELSGTDVNAFAPRPRRAAHGRPERDDRRRPRPQPPPPRAPTAARARRRAARCAGERAHDVGRAHPPARPPPARLRARDRRSWPPWPTPSPTACGARPWRDACDAVRTERGIGLVVLAADGSLAAVDPVANGGWPRCGTATHSPCGHGRRLPGAPHRGRTGAADAVARARVRTADGRWLVLHAAPSRGRSDHDCRRRTGPGARDRATHRERVRAHRAGAGRHPARRPRAGDRRDRRGAAPVALDRAGPPEGDLRQGGVRSRGELVARRFFPDDAPELTG